MHLRDKGVGHARIPEDSHHINIYIYIYIYTVGVNSDLPLRNFTRSAGFRIC